MDQILNPPETQDEGVWKYEHLRQFCMELNGLAVKLQVIHLGIKIQVLKKVGFHRNSNIDYRVNGV